MAWSIPGSVSAPAPKSSAPANDLPTLKAQLASGAINHQQFITKFASVANAPTNLKPYSVKNIAGAVGNTAKGIAQTTARTLPELAATLHPETTTNGKIDLTGTKVGRAILGPTPVSSIQQKTADTYKTVKAGAHPGRAIPQAAGEALLSAIQDATVFTGVGGAAKGASKEGLVGAIDRARNPLPAPRSALDNHIVETPKETPPPSPAKSPEKTSTPVATTKAVGQGSAKLTPVATDTKALTDHAMKFKTPQGFIGNAKTQALNARLEKPLSEAKLQNLHVKSLEPRNVPLETPAPTERVNQTLPASKVAKTTEAKAIQKNLTEGFGDLAGYSPTTHAEQSARVAQLITQDPERAMRIVNGHESIPDGISGSKLYKGLEFQATKNNDVGTLRQLAKSPLASGTSVHAQELSLLGEKNPHSPVAAMQDVVKARTTAAEKTLGKPVTQAVKETTDTIKQNIKPPTKDDWNSFVEALRCK